MASRHDVDQIRNSSARGSGEPGSAGEPLSNDGRARLFRPVDAVTKVVLGRLCEIRMVRQFEDAVKIGDGVVEEPLLRQADPAVQVGFRIVALNPQELPEIGERPVKVSPLGANLAPCEKRRRQSRIALDGSVEISQSERLSPPSHDKRSRAGNTHQPVEAPS